MEQTVRYNYRLEPTSQQTAMLNRLFGCCRVVYNDTVSQFFETFDPSTRTKLSASQIQTIVLTNAKKTSERAWLANVSNVALTQALRDAYQACWNAVRKDRKQRRVRFKSRKHNPVTSARFTKNGFHVAGKGVFIAKIGIIKVRWSRELPSEPTSCTIYQRADGHWHVSFVVKRDTTPLPHSNVNCAIDLGFKDMGALVATDGTRRHIKNPRHYTKTLKRIKREQKKLSRQQKGSHRYNQQRKRITRLYQRAHDRLNDFQNKQALQVIRETQAVGLETLNVRWMMKKHGKSTLNAAIGTFARKLESKAAQYGRTIEHIGRFHPSTKVCSQCSHYVKQGIPEEVRVWQCAECDAILDRDYNAAVNILDAAGLAESLNARGDGVRRMLATTNIRNRQRNVNPSDETNGFRLGIPTL